jgi:hypothetical protein
LSHYAGYNEEEISPVFKLMVDYLARPVTHEAFFKKYASKKFLKGKSSCYHPIGILLTHSSFDSYSAMGKEACCCAWRRHFDSS